MKMTRLGIAIIVLVVLATAARFMGPHGETAAAQADSSGSVLHAAR